MILGGLMIEITDSNDKDYKTLKKMWIGGIIAYNTMVPLFLFVIMPIFGNSFAGKYISLLILFLSANDIILLYLFYDTKKKFIPPKRVKISISDAKFEIYLQNRLYFQQFKDELKSIEIIKCKSYPDYDLNFIATRERINRLTRIILHEKKQRKYSKQLRYGVIK